MQLAGGVKTHTLIKPRGRAGEASAIGLLGFPHPLGSRAQSVLPTAPARGLPTPQPLLEAWIRSTASPGGRSIKCRAAPGSADMHTSQPFHERDFHRVRLVSAPHGPMQLYEDATERGSFNGVLLFQQEAGSAVPRVEDTPVVEVFVAGDTAFNTWTLLNQKRTDRPMVHELMWNLLNQVAAQHGGTWTLLHVAIVELRDNVFIGRLFFGDAATGDVKWDCDCRPSDGCYLSLQAGCPFYIHRRVWDQAAMPLLNTSAYQLAAGNSSAQRAPTTALTSAGQQGSASPAPASPSGPGPRSPEPSGTGRGAANLGNGDDEDYLPPRPLTVQDVTLLRPDDPDVIKLLKRELLVAVGEEDYAAAARIRDHPWMALYRQLHSHRMHGRYTEAHILDMELRRQIEAVHDLGG